LAEQKIREPKQKRSIEKKNKIILAGYELFCEKGYHNTNTAEIAKRACVSTGIVYNYFTDKKAIFIAVLDNFSKSLSQNAFSDFQTINPNFNLEATIKKVVDAALDMHLTFVSAHEELQAMSHSDPDVKDYYKKCEEEIVEMLFDSLKSHGYNIRNPHEKLHFVYDMVENYCHEVAYHKHDCLDNNVLKEIVVETILSILTKP
jgi:AcrR family transcriptional regulator